MGHLSRCDIIRSFGVAGDLKFVVGLLRPHSSLASLYMLFHFAVVSSVYSRGSSFMTNSFSSIGDSFPSGSALQIDMLSEFAAYLGEAFITFLFFLPTKVKVLLCIAWCDADRHRNTRRTTHTCSIYKLCLRKLWGTWGFIRKPAQWSYLGWQCQPTGMIECQW